MLCLAGHLLVGEDAVSSSQAYSLHHGQHCRQDVQCEAQGLLPEIKLAQNAGKARDGNGIRTWHAILQTMLMKQRRLLQALT